MGDIKRLSFNGNSFSHHIEGLEGHYEDNERVQLFPSFAKPFNICIIKQEPHLALSGAISDGKSEKLGAGSIWPGMVLIRLLFKT